jgi:hypothetical protein
MAAFTLFHVALSLVGIVSGFMVVAGFIANESLPRLTGTFLFTSLATSVTGFLFPFRHFLPSHAVGTLSVLVLTIAFFSRAKELRGGWRPTYAITAVIALYFNFFVLIAQAFLKIPTLNALAPHGNEPPFVAVQGAALLLFVGLGVASAIRFKGPIVGP